LTQIFFDFLGGYATRIVDFYRENQSWLNLIVLVYGILLALAHRNIQRLERQLREKTGLTDMYKIWNLIEADEIENWDPGVLKKELKLPILASPRHFFFYPVNRDSVLRILKKKYPRSKSA